MKIEKSGKKSAPPRRQPGQGGRDSESRRINNTTSATDRQHHISSPTATQRARILARLRIGPATTQELRDELRTMHPAGRIMELRRAGYRIITDIQENRVARYILVQEAGYE